VSFGGVVLLRSFKTIDKKAQAEIVEKKSRFIATVNPVSSEEEALRFIAEVKKKYWDATHNVFAFQVGQKNEVQRQSDDGEPSGTAGLPVLDVIRGGDLRFTAIVVTRYFGGTLLGTGGLVKAYGKAAKLGVEAAGIVDKVLYRYIYITLDYNSLGKIKYEILQREFVIYNIEYTDVVTLTILCPFDEAESFVKFINDISSGGALVRPAEGAYGKWTEGKLVMEA